MSYIPGKKIVDYLTVTDKFNYDDQVQQIGVDLTVEDVKEIMNLPRTNVRIYKSEKLLPRYIQVPLDRDENANNIFTLRANTSYSITFNEGCKLPNNVGGFIKGRSSLIRMGCKIESGMYDPGFQVDQMGCVLTTPNFPIDVELSSRIAQIVLQTTIEEVTNPYDGQYQGDKDVK